MKGQPLYNLPNIYNIYSNIVCVKCKKKLETRTYKWDMTLSRTVADISASLIETASGQQLIPLCVLTVM